MKVYSSCPLLEFVTRIQVSNLPYRDHEQLIRPNDMKWQGMGARFEISHPCFDFHHVADIIKYYFTPIILIW